MRILFTFYIVTLTANFAVHAQVADSVQADTTQILNDSSIFNADSIAASEMKPREPVYPWKSFSPYFSESITNDSLLRWNIFPNWGDFYAYRRGVISFRQGTIGREDAFNINGFDEYEQKVFLDGILLNDPISGLVNYNYVPHHKIGEVRESYAGTMNSHVNIRDYYINEPISYLNFDEAGNDYRNLEFMVAQNTAPGTNIELSYWDRREGGFYPNNGIEGSQIVGRMYHHLGKKYQLQGLILRNDLKRDEPGGYETDGAFGFTFDEFASIPKSSSGKSEILRNDIKVGIYERADTTAPETGGFTLTRTKNDREVRIFSDTLSWKLITYNADVFKEINGSLFSVKGSTGLQYSNLKSGTTIDQNSWVNVNVGVKGVLTLAERINVLGSAQFIARNTSHNGFLYSLGIRAGSENRINLKLSASRQSKIPSVQNLYWQSKRYFGNSDLANEKISSVFGEVNLPLAKHWELGVLTRLKLTENTVVLNTDSTFSNAVSQNTVFGSGFIRFENAKFEIESSAAVEFELDSDFAPNEALLNTVDSKLWLRNSLFYKTYAFNRAAFLKLGVRTLVSPFNYQSRFYNTELSYWQNNSLTTDGNTQAIIPSFFRVDAELSARVRAIMVVMRWENVLDGLGQAGYFEAASFPMQPRRLIVGIRAQFRN